MTPISVSDRRGLYRWVTIILAILITCRIVMMITLPHIDTSESRYAEISRKMVETGDWITPQFDYGIPFWAKPPLSMWMSALGMDLFGANEFGSRVFIFLAAMAVLAMTERAASRESDNLTGRTAAMILMAMPLFFYCSAAVMTDLALALGTTMTMIGFRSAIVEKSKHRGYLFFTGLAIGLLAKGPLVLVLATPPLVGWLLVTKQWREAWKNLPWVSGTLLMLILSLPWYVAAEIKTPGFLDYFIIGEHWNRFLVRGWKGDLYGNAHSEVPGTIWLHLILTTFPWCLGFLAIRFRGKAAFIARLTEENGKILYWVIWAAWPVIFFTPSRNIIATYPLPALPPLAILLTGMIFQGKNKEDGTWIPSRFHVSLAGLSVAFTLFATLLTSFVPALLPKRNEREIVKCFETNCDDEDRLLYYGIRRYSAEFYSGGQSEQTNTPEELLEKMEAPGRLFVAATTRGFSQIPPNIQRRLIPVMKREGKQTSLYVERDDTPVMTGIDASKTYPIGG